MVLRDLTIPRRHSRTPGITSFGYDRTTNTYEVEVDGVKIGLFGVNELDGVEKGHAAS